MATAHNADPSSTRPSIADMKKLARQIQPVSSAERRVVNQKLNCTGAELGRTEAEMNRLRARLMVLENKVEGFRDIMVECTSLLSPIRRLPPELLVQVFKDYCDSIEEQFITPFRDPAALVLSQVCGRWRQLALSTPRLWSSIWFKLTQWCTGYGDVRRLERLAKIYIERSQTVPLSITLNAANLDTDISVSLEQLEPTIATIRCLVESSRRWRHLDFDHCLLNLPAFKGVNNRLPRLEHLQIHSDDADEAVSPFINCPSLTSLDIKPARWNKNDFPLARLTSFSLWNSYTPAALALLKLCTHLERLEFHAVGGFSNEEPDTHAHVVLPHVRHLVVCAKEEEDATTIFDSCSLPSLSEIWVRRDPNANGDWRAWDIEPFKNLLRQSSCAITSLSLSSVPLIDKETISLLRLMPTLTNLSIEERTEISPENQIITLAFLKLLTVTVLDANTPRALLPSLRHLTLSMHHAQNARQALIGAIASRAPDVQDTAATSATRLQSFHLTLMVGEKPVDAEVFVAQLRCFRDVGLLVDVVFEEI